MFVIKSLIDTVQFLILGHYYSLKPLIYSQKGLWK